MAETTGLPPQTTAEPPLDRFCDLVMKGGITSGVVYPRAIEQLSRHYRFKSIGGKSAGAIAAAVTAAAELQRRRTGSRAGFDLLKGLPDELMQVPHNGHRKLLSLFQPQPKTRRLFRVLVNALNSKGTRRRIGAVLGGALMAYWPATLGGVLLAFAVLHFGGNLAASLTLPVAWAVLIGLMVYRDLTRHAVANGFGLCTGLTENQRTEALTPWLHRLIQTAAGLKADDSPLTFGMLWDAPHPPDEHPQPNAGETRRSIDLQMFSTNLTHGRPYIFPLAEHDPNASHYRSRDRLYFDRDALARYLPPDVLAWMVERARPYTVDPGREDRDPTLEEAAQLGLVELPPPRDFPVLLAARMSLSFPFLFSAVPLWAIDHDQGGRAPFRRCWFSDGGISSNFPMHLFDGLVPRWPTFGINLEDKLPDRPNMTYLPAGYGTGYGERWTRFDEPGFDGAKRLGGFVSALLGTMQNWNDNALSRMPGVRDRIVRVRLKEEEGGLNLNMEAEAIRDVAERGEQAALELIKRFAPQGNSLTPATGWDEQRWVRLGVLLKMVQQRAPGVRRALESSLPHATPIEKLIERAGNPNGPPPAGYPAPLTPEQQRALRLVVDALGDMVGTTADPGLRTDFEPIPKPELRVRPPL